MRRVLEVEVGVAPAYTIDEGEAFRRLDFHGRDPELLRLLDDLHGAAAIKIGVDVQRRPVVGLPLLNVNTLFSQTSPLWSYTAPFERANKYGTPGGWANDPLMWRERV